MSQPETNNQIDRDIFEREQQAERVAAMTAMANLAIIDLDTNRAIEADLAEDDIRRQFEKMERES